MVSRIKKIELGTGLYTPAEASRFAKLRLQTFNRWLFGNQQGGSAIPARLNFENGDRFVTFCDLIQAVAVRNLRTSEIGRRISLECIRDVVAECTDRGITFPLARSHTLYWFSNRLILETDNGELIGVTKGVDKNQLYERRIIEPFLTEVTFGDDKLAEKWAPLSHREFTITLDANRRFGLPIVEPGGVLVEALIDSVEAEGSIDRAADAFEVEKGAVLAALKYSEYLSSAA